MSVTRARTQELKFLVPNYDVACILKCRVPGIMSRKNVFLTLRFPVIKRRGANNSTKISSRTSRNEFLVQGHFGGLYFPVKLRTCKKYVEQNLK